MKSNRRLITTVFVLSLMAGLLEARADTIWSEDFTGDVGDGLVGPSNPDVYDDGNWYVSASNADLSASTDWIKVNSSGQMEARDTDGDVVWVSEAIDISSYSGVGISLNAYESGTMESADYVRSLYSLNGGAPTQIDYSNDDFSSATHTASGLSGNSLVVIVRMACNAGTEYLRFDNVVVSGTPAGSSPPSVTTGSNNPSSPSDPTQATAYGNVTADGGETVTERGIVWSESGTPTTASYDGKQTAAGTTGSFNVTITGLTPGQNVNYRAYAINSEGTGYGSTSSFTADCFGPPTIQAGSSIGSDNFTANWSDVTGATTFFLDVATNDAFSAGGGGAIQLGESFDSGLAGSYTTGNQTLTSGVWYTVAVYPEASGASYSGDHAARMNDDTAGASIRTPSLNGAGTVHFWYRELNSGGGTFQVQKSYNGSSYTTVSNVDFSGTSYQECYCDINDSANPIYIRVLSDNQSGHLIVDEFTVTSAGGGSSDFVDGYEDRNVGDVTSASVTGLSAEVTYYYRVRAYSSNCGQTGDSSTQSVTTAAAGTAPTVTSPTDTSITHNSATLGANVTDDGGVSLTEKGVVWATTSNPDTGDNKVAHGTTATGVFTVNASGLPSGTLVYYRGYAINSVDTAYSAQDSFYTEPSSQPTLTVDSTTASSMTLSWSGDNGDGVIVVIRQGSAVAATPTDGTEHSANSVFGSGANLGSSQYVVYRGSGSSVTVSGLSAGQTYHVAAFAYAGSGSAINYQQDTPGTASDATLSTSVPTLISPTAVSISSTGATLGATISGDGNSTITARGTVWGTSANPTGNSLAEGGTAVGAFSHARVNMPPGTLIYYRGYAVNGIGTGYSADGTFWTIPLAPVASAASSVGASSFNANWAAATGATEYRLDVSANSGFSSFVTGYNNLDVNNVVTYAVNSGLTAGNTYYYRVRAVNSGGTSTNSNTRSVLLLCNAPTANAGSNPSTSGFRANWSAPSGGAPTSYKLYVSTVASCDGSYVTGYGPKTGISALYDNVSGLAAGTRYYYRVVAVNASGDSASSGIQSIYTYSTEPAGHAGSFAAAAASSSSINLTWTAASGASGYLILRRQGANPTGTPTDGTSYTVGNTIGDGTIVAITPSLSASSGSLTANTQYNYSIIPYAWDGANSATYNYRTAATIPTANATTLPADLSSFTATAGGVDQINLAFSGNGGLNVVIVYDEDGSFTTPTGTPTVGQPFAGGTVLYDGTSSPQSHTGLTGCKTYYYKAWVRNGTAYSLNGSTDDATTANVGVPTGLHADPTNTTSFTAAWSATTGADGYRLDVSTSETFAVSGGAAGDLIFSQYTETDSGTTPKGVEIWNATGADITFNGTDKQLVILKGVNGGTPSADFTLSSGTISAGGVLVIGTSDMSPDYEKAFTFNGDDALVLQLGGVTMDVIGLPGNDPGSAWSGGGVSTADRSIKLKTGITTGDTDGWTDPSTRFEDVSAGSTLTDFGTAPSGGGGGSTPSYVTGYSNLAVAGTSRNVTGLDSGRTYYFRVRAEGGTCVSGDSTTSSVTTIVATAPEIAVLGINHLEIADGETATSSAYGTDFGSTYLGGTVDRTLYITNMGNATLTVSGVTTAGTHKADFKVIAAPASIAAGDRGSLTLRFEPTAAGTRTATIHVNNNDSDEGDYDFAVEGAAEASDTTPPTMTAWGVNSANNTNLTDFQFLSFTVRVAIADSTSGVAWSANPPNYAITNPAGSQALAPTAFDNTGHTHGENSTVVTGWVSGLTGALGHWTVGLSAQDQGRYAWTTNFGFWVRDDDATPPVKAEIDYGGFASRFFSVVTGAVPTLVTRAHDYADVKYTVTDADLAEAPSRNLQFAFGLRDAGHGLARGTAGTTNEVVSFSLGTVIEGNRADFSAVLSSGNATNTTLTNIWDFASGFDSATINALMSVSSNACRITAPDDDTDRADDRALLVSERMGWVVVEDDDAIGPVLSSLALIGGSGGVGNASELMISEYVEGSSNNKAVEIFNGTGSAIDLGTDQYVLQGYHNGNTSPSYTIALSGSLPANTAYVVVYNQADAGLLAYGSLTNSSMNFNGNDALVLRKGGASGTVIDSFGEVGFDPGSAWTAGGVTTENKTLRRKSTVSEGDTNTGNDFDPSVEWDQYDEDTFTGLGAHDMSGSGTAFTDDMLFTGISFTGLVADADSGVYGLNEFSGYAPTATIFRANGDDVGGGYFLQGPNNGGGLTATLISNTIAIDPGDIVLGETYTCRVVVTDYDLDRVGDASSVTQELVFAMIDDDTNAPALSTFKLDDNKTVFDTCAGSSIALTGLVSEASGLSDDAYFLVVDFDGVTVQSGRLYAASAESATGTLLRTGLNSGFDYTVQVFAVDNDADRGDIDRLATSTNRAMVFSVDGTGGGGYSDLLATNLVIDGAAAGPSATVTDAALTNGAWSIGVNLWASEPVFTNGATPAFTILDPDDVVLANDVRWTNITVDFSTYSLTNDSMPAIAAAFVKTGLHQLVWSASNNSPCIAQVWSNNFVAGGTNLFTVVDDDTAPPTPSGFSVAGGVFTISVTEASAGFSITGRVQDAASGIAFATETAYWLFYNDVGAVLASNDVEAVYADGVGRAAAIGLTNGFSGLSLSCGSVCTVKLFAADADADRTGDRAAAVQDALVLWISGEGGADPTAENLRIDGTAAASAELTDAEFVAGGWQLALKFAHPDLLTNGAYAPTFSVRDPSNNLTYASSLSWSTLVEEAASLYSATNTYMPPADTNKVTATGAFTVVWSARSEGLCFGEVFESDVIDPVATFTVVDDDPDPPFVEDNFSVAGGTLGGGSGTQDCDDYSTNLVAGDIAIIGMNTLTTGTTNHDSFAFVALRPLPAGTQIKFTDNGWTGTALYDNEGTLEWTADTCVTAGTVVIWKNFTRDAYNPDSYTDVNYGTMELISGMSKRFEPNTAGEQIFAYQGDKTSPTFIYGLHTGLWGWPRPTPPNRPGGGTWKNSEQSALPPGLVEGETCVAVENLNDTVIDTETLVIHGFRADVLAYLSNPDNWVGNDTFVYPLDTWTFTFPEIGSVGGSISDYDVLVGGWDITGRVYDAISGLSTNLLLYQGINTAGVPFVTASFTNTFTYGTKDWVNIGQSSVQPGTYAHITIGTNVVRIYAQDVDNDRANDAAVATLDVPFTVYDDDTDSPQFLSIDWNGKPDIDVDNDLAALVVTARVQDISSGLAFTSSPPVLRIYDLDGTEAYTTNFDFPPGLQEGTASNSPATIWTRPINLASVLECGSYTCHVVLVDADDDRPDDGLQVTNQIVIALSSGTADSPELVGDGLIVKTGMPAQVTLTDADIRWGGWPLSITLEQPTGVMTNAPEYPRYQIFNTSGVDLVAHPWTNFTIWGSANEYFSGTNCIGGVMPEEVDLVETGEYTLVWAARSYSACDGGAYVVTNFYVVDDDETPPEWSAPDIAVTAEGRPVYEGWTNIDVLSITWTPATDASGVDHRQVIGGPQPTGPENTLTAPPSGFTDVTIEEGVRTNWFFPVDRDNDRPNDWLMGPVYQVVTRIDTTRPDAITGFVENPNVPNLDDTTEVALEWNRAGPGDRGTNRLSPWRSYLIYAAQIDPVGPTSVFTAAQIDMLGNTNTTSLILSNLIFGTTYRLWMAGQDEAGNIGPTSVARIVTLAEFSLTQGVAVAQSQGHNAHLSWTAKTVEGEVVREYDLLYTDAGGFFDGLSNTWKLAGSVTNSAFLDAGGTNKYDQVRPPPGLVNGGMRFYRAAPFGKWSTNFSQRPSASEEVYVAKPIALHPGANWVAYPGVPDTMTVARVFGTNLHAGTSSAEATTITWYERSADIPWTQMVWLCSNPLEWRNTAGQNANDTVVPLRQGCIVRIPPSKPTIPFLFVGRVPTEPVGEPIKGDRAKNLVQLNLPRSAHPSQMNLTNANGYGFQGGHQPGPHDNLRRNRYGSDVIFKWDPIEQRIADFAGVWLRSSDGAWLLSSPGYPPCPTDYFKPDECLLIHSATNTPDWVWTNRLLYTPPNRYMNP